jgi:cysteine desulfurase NifS/selenium donor protein
MNEIYLDYNGTTPVDPHVADAMLPYLSNEFGNPSSTHGYGLRAKIAIETARREVAHLLNASPDEIIFTGSGTESNNMAIRGAAHANRLKGNHIITTKIEHPAITEVCKNLAEQGFEITWVGVDPAGMVNPEEIREAIRSNTILISVMHANNETGTIQPIGEIGRIAREKGIIFHTDAAQSVGKIPVDVRLFQCDLLSVAGHKLYAPKGVGALYVRRGVRIQPVIFGAGQESGIRPGTENVPEIVGLGKAASIASDYLSGIATGRQPDEITRLRDLLHKGILKNVSDCRLNGHSEMRLPGTLSLGFPGVEAPVMLDRMKGVAASAGAACHTGSETISGVLSAMQVPERYAMGTIRFSIGRMTTEHEIDEAVVQICRVYMDLTEPENNTASIKETSSHENPQSDAALNESLGTSIRVDEEPYGIREIRLPESREPNEIRLTEYTHALGCACKIRPQLLETIVRGMPVFHDPRLLVGTETSDDAAVYLLDNDHALVQTIDLIPPVVDDPYDFGAIAAANALSDIYAMGGNPLFALGIVGFPDRRLPIDVLQRILAGAADKLSEAGIQTIGGHSIEDGEPKFGLVITGLVHPANLLRNSTARAGDALVLTKPIGTGIITTAIKRGLARAEDLRRVTSVMTELNRDAAAIALEWGATACTDVTGFGLLGHLKEMAFGSGLRVSINFRKVPVIGQTWHFAVAGAIPGGSRNNLEYVADCTEWKGNVSEMMKLILSDAQTSGGLLVAVPPENASEMTEKMHSAGLLEAAIIGHFNTGPAGITVSES